MISTASASLSLSIFFSEVKKNDSHGVHMVTKFNLFHGNVGDYEEEKSKGPARRTVIIILRIKRKGRESSLKDISILIMALIQPYMDRNFSKLFVII